MNEMEEQSPTKKKQKKDAGKRSKEEKMLKEKKKPIEKEAEKKKSIEEDEEEEKTKKRKKGKGRPMHSKEEKAEKERQKAIYKKRGRRVNHSFGIISEQKSSSKPKLQFTDKDRTTFSKKVDELTTEPAGYEQILCIVEQINCHIGYKNVLINKILQRLKLEPIEVTGYNYLLRQIVHANADVLYNPAKSADKEQFIQRWIHGHFFYMNLSVEDPVLLDDVVYLRWMRTATELVKMFDHNKTSTERLFSIPLDPNKASMKHLSATMLGSSDMEMEIELIERLYSQDRTWITHSDFPFTLENILTLDSLRGNTGLIQTDVYDYHVREKPPPFLFGEYHDGDLTYTHINLDTDKFVSPIKHEVKVEPSAISRRVTINYEPSQIDVVVDMLLLRNPFDDAYISEYQENIEEERKEEIQEEEREEEIQEEEREEEEREEEIGLVIEEEEPGEMHFDEEVNKKVRRERRHVREKKVNGWFSCWN